MTPQPETAPDKTAVARIFEMASLLVGMTDYDPDHDPYDDNYQFRGYALDTAIDYFLYNTGQMPKEVLYGTMKVESLVWYCYFQLCTALDDLDFEIRTLSKAQAIDLLNGVAVRLRAEQ